MDPLSHAAFGRTLLALAPEQHGSRSRAAAAALGALSPDLDAVLMPMGWDLYLRVHEIGTHTIAGAIGSGMLAAVVMRPFMRGTPWMAIAIPAILGSLSHLLLDLISSARLRVFWPLDDRQVSIPLVAMADPWLAGLLVAGAVALAWSGRPRRVAAATVAAVALFLSIKALFALEALDAYDMKQDVASPVATPVVEAKWASLREWHVMDRTSDRLRVWRIRSGLPEPALILSWPVLAEAPVIAASRSLPVVRNFLRVHQLVLAVTIPQPDGRSRVLWSDIRYCWDPSSEGAPQLDPHITEGSHHLACALWFGGEFDRAGRPIRQIVKVFGFTQTRPAGS